MEHPHPIKASFYELLELLLDDSHLVLLHAGTTPRPAIPLLWPPTTERREWRRRWILDVKPLPVPPPVGVTGEYVGYESPTLGFLCRAKPPTDAIAAELQSAIALPEKKR